MKANDRFSSPLVTCCTLTYNNFDYVFETIESVLHQTYNRIELIISDDGSTVFPEEAIVDYINKHKRSNIENVIVLANAINKGTVKNYNSAIKAASGEYILPVSCGDVLFDQNVVSRVVDKFIETGWDLISFRRLLCEEKGLKPIRPMPRTEDIPYIHELCDSFSQFKALSGARPFFEMASGSSTCYKKTLFDAIGLFDESYKLWEDGPFFVRYTRAGKVIHYDYDLYYIKYRYGGISTKRIKKSATSIQLKVDCANMLKKEVIPYYKRFSLKERRVIKCNYFCDKHFSWNKMIIAFFVLLLWPELFFKRFTAYNSTKRVSSQ